MTDHSLFGTNARSHTVAYANSRKTECKRGHSLSVPNLDAGSASRGSRRCRTCLYAASWAQRNGHGLDDPETLEYAARRYSEIMTGE